MSMERAVELPSGQHVCLGCGQVLDKVVASFAVLGWDDITEDYSKVVDVGDFACPYCGEAVHITKFYPPEEQQERPAPKTYGDWVDLAENIKSADPASWTAAWVNEALQHISEEDLAAEGSKRKLVQRASELGIT